MNLPIEVHVDAPAAARRVAALITERARGSVESQNRFTLAVSRAPEMLGILGGEDLPWAQITVYQVDERVAPAGHEDRNHTRIRAALPQRSVRPMPVEDENLDEASERYAAEVPKPLDLVHLGLGQDGHTASLVPGDPVLDVHDRLVAVTHEYQGRRRMTLTYPALDAAREIVWLVTGNRKRDALRRLLAGDTSIPASRIANPHQLVVADEDALS